MWKKVFGALVQWSTRGPLLVMWCTRWYLPPERSWFSTCSTLNMCIRGWNPIKIAYNFFSKCVNSVECLPNTLDKHGKYHSWTSDLSIYHLPPHLLKAQKVDQMLIVCNFITLILKCIYYIIEVISNSTSKLVSFRKKKTSAENKNN